MYILVCYNNFENTRINGLVYFDDIKDIISFTNGVIKYSDTKTKKRYYRTYKSLFKIVRVRKDHLIKYFSGLFFEYNKLLCDLV